MGREQDGPAAPDAVCGAFGQGLGPEGSVGHAGNVRPCDGNEVVNRRDFPLEAGEGGGVRGMGVDDRPDVRPFPVEGQVHRRFAGRFPGTFDLPPFQVHDRDILRDDFKVFNRAGLYGHQLPRAVDDTEVPRRAPCQSLHQQHPPVFRHQLPFPFEQQVHPPSRVPTSRDSS